MTIKILLFESLLLKVEHISYTMGNRALPDIYTLALRTQKALVPMV